MTYTQPPGQGEPRRRGAHDGGIHAPGIHVSTGRDTDIRDSELAGRDLLRVGDKSIGIQGTQFFNSRLVIRNGTRPYTFPLLAVVAVGALLLLAASLGLYGTVAKGHGIDTQAVFVAGEPGARKTLAALKKAEKAADAPAWCRLAQPGESGCLRKISAVFDRAPASYRKEIDKVGVGDITVSDDIATAMMLFNGKRQGTVRLAWERNRWQLGAGDYAVLLFAGGLYLSIVDAAHHNGPFDNLFPSPDPN